MPAVRAWTIPRRWELPVKFAVLRAASCRGTSPSPTSASAMCFPTRSPTSCHVSRRRFGSPKKSQVYQSPQDVTFLFRPSNLNMVRTVVCTGESAASKWPKSASIKSLPTIWDESLSM